MKELSKEYAVAIFTLGKESGREDLFERSLKQVVSVLHAHPEYRAFLTSPGIPMESRLSGIRETFSGDVCEEVQSFLELLCRRGRLEILEDCLKVYQELLRVSHNTAIAKVTSAIPLSQEERNCLQIQLEKKSGRSVVLSCFVKPELIGGMIVEMDGSVLDGSLKTRLEQVKDVVSQ